MDIRAKTESVWEKLRDVATMKIRRNCKHLLTESDTTECIMHVTYENIRENVIKAGLCADFFRVKDGFCAHLKTLKYENTRNPAVLILLKNGAKLYSVTCRRSIPGKNSVCVETCGERVEKRIAEEFISQAYGMEAVAEIRYTGGIKNHWADFRFRGEGYEIKLKGAFWSDKYH